MDLARRRATTETRIADLQQARGTALLDGKSFDPRELTALETELAAIDAAEGEVMRRQRVAASEAERERMANLRVTLTVVEENRLAAVDRAEKAARDLVENLKEVRARAADVARLLRALGSGSLPLEETENRMSWRLTAALKPLTGFGRRYGQIVTPEARSPFNDPWRAAEQAVAGPDVSKALKGFSE
ncbi:hypothetical protein [Mesorhizobium sp. M0088]|uniref:hypothetical protein n=1 Tax=Mesorhizobium sp. M0088 TaxID=2956873 RepID=UPI00333CF792